MMERNRGHIVNISSLAGLYGTPHACHYSASKSAVLLFSDALRYELDRYNKEGVKVTCICPGFIKTDLTEDKNTG